MQEKEGRATLARPRSKPRALIIRVYPRLSVGYFFFFAGAAGLESSTETLAACLVAPMS